MLDIDRDRQRISLGLKQTQEDPWQRVVDTYHVGDELEGTVTKVVAFGAFVEILEGVEGLVHISELAQQHVENPREIVAAGRRGARSRSSRSTPSAAACRCRSSASRARCCRAAPSLEQTDAGDLEDMPELGLSEDVFAEQPPAGGRGGSAEAEAVAEPRPRRAEPSRGRGRARGGGRAEAEAEADAAEPRHRPRPRSRRPTRGRRAGVVVPPPFVGLTGGIGAGKSEALAALERLGAATISTDAVVHELYDDPRGARRRGRALGRRGRARRARWTAAAVAEHAFAADAEPRVARGHAVAARWASAIAEWRAARGPARAAAARAGGRDAAAVRGGAGVRLRRDDRGRGRRGGARASAPARAATRRSTSAPRASSPRRRRPRGRRTLVENAGSSQRTGAGAVGRSCEAEQR